MCLPRKLTALAFCLWTMHSQLEVSFANEVIVDLAKVNSPFLVSSPLEKNVSTSKLELATRFCHSQGFYKLVSLSTSGERLLGRIQDHVFAPSPCWEFIAGKEEYFFADSEDLYSKVCPWVSSAGTIYSTFSLLEQGFTYLQSSNHPMIVPLAWGVAALTNLFIWELSTTFPDSYAYVFDELKCQGEENNLDPELLKHAKALGSLEEVPETNLTSARLNKLNKPLCPVCRAKIKIGQKILSTPCKHDFHHNCVTSWLALYKTCPVCRQKTHISEAGYYKIINP